MILDHLWTILEVDSSKLDAGLKKARQSTDDLVNGMKDAEGKGTTSVMSMTRAVGLLAGGLLAAGTVARTLSGAVELAERTADLGDLSDNLGIAVEKVDALGKAMFTTGGNAESALADLQSFSERLGKAYKDADSPIGKTLTNLKIGLVSANGDAKDAVDIMIELSGALEGLKRPEALANLKQLGITDPKIIENILKGRKEFEALLRAEKERGVITQAQVERARKLADANDSLRAGVRRLTDGFLDKFIPAMTKVIQWLDRVVTWAGKHGDAIAGFFLAIGGVIAAVYLPSMLAAAAATIAATWPILLAIAAVTALAAAFALAYEDVQNFIDGNDSLIGDIFEKYPMVEAMVMGTLEALRSLGEGVVAVYAKAWEIIKAFGAGIASIARTVGGLLEKLPGGFVADVNSSQTVQNAAQNSPMNGTTSNAISNQSSSVQENKVQVGQVVVNTQATDAKGVATDVKGELQTQLQSLQAENSSGVVR